MSTVTVVPTVESSNVPPRIRLDVTDVGTSPAITATTVVRLDPDGVNRSVRTSDGNPLILTTSGSNRVGTLYDYEAPFGQPVSYSTAESPTVISAEVTVDSGSAWLIHPGVPELSQQITIGEVGARVRKAQRGIFYPMGRETPVVQTDGQRKAPEYDLSLYAPTDLALQGLLTLCADSGPLLLNVPAVNAWGITAEYVSFGDLSERRLSRFIGAPERMLDASVTVVDRPEGGSQAQRTYADVLVTYASYNAVKSAYGTYLSLLTGP